MDISRIGFKAMYIHRNWTPWMHEQALIQHYGGRCSWNGSSFGSNDPGRKRDKTEQPMDGFDRMFPVNPDLATSIAAGQYNAGELAILLKAICQCLFQVCPRRKSEEAAS